MNDTIAASDLAKLMQVVDKATEVYNALERTVDDHDAWEAKGLDGETWDHWHDLGDALAALGLQEF